MNEKGALRKLFHINFAEGNPAKLAFRPATARGEFMASIVRIAVPVISIFASGWLLRDPMSVPLWQLGLGLLLASIGVAWLYLRQS
ncbi:hypothetical protein KMZ68_06305 [Bradyrhizobium sediminis]|uniref:Uncharacterized protein n=1 Tax=Bradyrhizobium sediminis TaxID=2840469 RepID=A0A975RTA9_9BRAD|nr:hypothetical protein [Bradyrhizobium sediminis]QWG19455.1 hypothetical protein KMZ68_06305 [Bradyrhizobium sediminis]